MSDYLFQREAVALLVARLLASDEFGERVGMVFHTIGNTLLTRYAPEVLDRGPVIAVVQGVAVSIAVPRLDTALSVDEILQRLYALEIDVYFVIQRLDLELSNDKSNSKNKTT